MRARIGALGLGLLIVLAGCMEAESDVPERVSAEALRLPGPYLPVVINATVVPGEVVWHLPLQDGGCEEYDRMLSTVKVYDRFGWQKTYELHVDRSKAEPTNFTLQLPGEAPWVVAGRGHSCASVWHQKILGATEGFWPGRPEDGGAGTYRELQLPVHVQVGEQVAEVVWDPDPRVYYLDQVVHRTDDREGGRYGEITMTDSQGNLTRIERYSLIDGESFSYPPYMLIEGPYKIRLELEFPALVSTTWLYTIQYFELGENFCSWGLEWADIC